MSWTWNRIEGGRYPGEVAGSESRGTGNGGEEGGFTSRAAIGYDHGYEAEGFYLGLALDAAVLRAWSRLP